MSPEDSEQEKKEEQVADPVEPADAEVGADAGAGEVSQVESDAGEQEDADSAASAAAEAAAAAMADEALADAGLDSKPYDASEPADLPGFTGTTSTSAENNIELLNDVELDVKIELGRAEMSVEEILRLTNGSVVELNRLAGDPVDVLVNEQLVARGEVLVVNDTFCVRINEIIKGIDEGIVAAVQI